MMNRPSFQFYPNDWRSNAKLRRCSEAARGAWMDVLCVLHDSDEYGVCRWPLADLARAAGTPLKLVKELASKDVLKGDDHSAQPYIFKPRHAGTDGEPVTLVTSGDGPCWFCSRFVRDEYIRLRRGQSTQFSETNQPTKGGKKGSPKPSPKGGFGERQGDGPSSSSSSSSSKKENDKSFSSVCDFSFEDFWEGFGKKVDRAKCEKAWSKLSNVNFEKIKEVLSSYVQSTPDVQFRKNPLTWLNGKCWNDEPASASLANEERCPLGNAIDRAKHPDFPADKPYTKGNITRFYEMGTSAKNLKDDNS